MLVAMLVAAATAQPHQLCSTGQNAPYCICGAERQANDMALDFTVVTNPPQNNFNVIMGMTFDHAITCGPGPVPCNTQVLLTTYIKGIPSYRVSLFSQASPMIPAAPWPLGYTEATANFGCDLNGCTSNSDEYFWQLEWFDQFNSQMLCVRSEIFNQGMDSGTVPPLCPPGQLCKRTS